VRARRTSGLCCSLALRVFFAADAESFQRTSNDRLAEDTAQSLADCLGKFPPNGIRLGPNGIEQSPLVPSIKLALPSLGSDCRFKGTCLPRPRAPLTHAAVVDTESLRDLETGRSLLQRVPDPLSEIHGVRLHDPS